MHLAVSPSSPSVFASSLCVMLTSVSTNAEAKSLWIHLFSGTWRDEGQHCAGFGPDEPYLDFDVDSRRTEYVSFGKFKCKLDFTNDQSFTVADPKKCAKGGFPTEYIGTFSLAQIDKSLTGSKLKTVDGHLVFKNLKGDVNIMQDCRRNK